VGVPISTWGTYTVLLKVYLYFVLFRFIVHHDLNNPLVSSLEEFGSRLPHFRPHLLVVSGLQMMDNFPFR
jgi:hypothetical protein